MIGHLVVEVVTPLMLGGAEAGKLDNPPTLRPPSLRGHLRFWSRALGGEEKEIEQKFWGEETIGQRVRILSVATMRGRGQRIDLNEGQKARLLERTQQHGETWMDMVPPGDKVILRFEVPAGVNLDQLQAVLWTWLHLGTVGRRSRRGYGSLEWRPSEGDLLTGWPPLWPSHHLRSQETLEKYLREGLTKVGEIFPRIGSQDRQDTESLDTLDQVFVGGKELPGIWQASDPKSYYGNLEHIVHGLNKDHRGTNPDRRQLGLSAPRLPSPILWRFFRVGKNTFRPVMTWFPTGYGTQPVQLGASGSVFQHLHNHFGFEKSLTGNKLAG